MSKLLLVFLLLISFELQASVFTVTSNANDGAGTLRDAIMQANGNGTATADYIYFNIPGNTVTAMSIVLTSELPVLSSNLIIDGTTQPFAAFGNPNIKISLIRVAADFFNGLRLDHASHIEIYGLSFSNFKSDPLGTVDEKKGGIYLYDSQDVIIGASNKPNCFNGNYAGILSPYTIPRLDVVGVKISGNIFGLGENGLNSIPNETGIDMSFLKNSVIGGSLPGEGNVLANNTRANITLGGADEVVLIQNNSIGFDKNLSPKPTPLANGIYVNGAGAKPKILGNLIGGMAKAIMLDYVNSGFNIAQNRIGTGLLGTENYTNDIGIHVNFSLGGMIGGQELSEQNFIANNKTAILVEISYPVSILKNSMYCNTSAVLFKNLPPGKSITPSRISSIAATGASGTYLPGSIVELFYVDSCPDCQGKTWLATVPTAADGSWIYSGPVNGKITSMGTNADGATSNFSKPLIDDSGKQVIGVYCGENTGSIKNIKVYDASVFQWFNVAGQVVGTAKDLENVGAGSYYLKTGQLGACDAVSSTYVIPSTGNGIDDSKKIINDVYCGAANGSIQNITVVNNLPRTWYDALGNVIASTADLDHVPAGSYYFKAGQGGCEITSPVYTIKSIDLIYRVSSVSLANSSCGKNNGSIIVRAYDKDKPTVVKWINEHGDVLGSAEALTQVGPGTYTFIASNGNGCTNVAGTFTIEEAELPKIELSEMQEFISCDGQSISTSGIKIVGGTGPFNYQWINESGEVAFTGLELKNIKVDQYILFVTDGFGCKVQTPLIDFSQLKQQILQIPSAISPNGDGVNDVWKINGVNNYPEAEFSVFNRNGGLLFYSKGYAKPFDGTNNGKPIPAGVYYYLIDLKTGCGRLSGSLTIIR